MKYFIGLIFAFVVVFENATATAMLSKQKVDEKFGLGFLGDNSCQKICKDFNLAKNKTTFPDGSWQIDFQIDVHEVITIAYNRTSNFLALHNTKFDISWVFAGNENRMGFFNLKTGALLTIHVLTFDAKLIKDINIELLTVQFPMLRFAFFFDFLMLQSISINDGHLSFNIIGFLHAFRLRNLKVFFQSELNLLDDLETAFGSLFHALRTFEAVPALIEPLVFDLGDVGLEFIAAIDGILVKSVGFTADLMIQIFDAFTNGVRFAANSVFKSIQYSLGITSGILHSIGGMFLGIGSTFHGILRGEIRISGGASLSITTGSTNQHSWIAFYGNQSAEFSVIYNETHNGIGFINDQLHLVFIASGNDGLSAVYNLTTGIGLAVNSDGNLAKILNDPTGEVKKLFSEGLNLSESFALLFEILLQSADFTVSEEMVFNYENYLQNGTNQFEGREDVEVLLLDNFGLLILLAREDSTENGFEIGFHFVFRPVFGQNILGDSFAELFDMIFAQLKGRFTPKLMWNVFLTLNTNIEAGRKGFVHLIFGGFLKLFVAIAKIPGNILKAIDHILFLPKVTAIFNFGWGEHNIGFHLGNQDNFPVMLVK